MKVFAYCCEQCRGTGTRDGGRDDKGYEEFGELHVCCWAGVKEVWTLRSLGVSGFLFILSSHVDGKELLHRFLQ